MALRFGLFGTGYWAAEVHAAGLTAHPGADLVGVWGRDPAKAAAIAERFDTRPYDDVDALIAEVDAIAVALPPDVQAGIAIRAARAGRHLLLDKPLALDTATADEIVAAAGAGGVSSVIFFNRYYANVEAVLRDCAAQRWDGARVSLFASIFQPDNPFGASPWRRERGGLWDIGPHALAFVLPVLGPAESVTAVEGPHQTAHLLVRHRSGAVSTLALTLDAPAAACSRLIEFYGDSGIVSLPNGDVTPLESFGSAITQFVDNVAAGSRTHPCDVRFGRDVVAVIEAADAAIRTGTAQRVP